MIQESFEKALRVQKLVADGETLMKALKKEKMSTGTYYKVKRAQEASNTPAQVQIFDAASEIKRSYQKHVDTTKISKGAAALVILKNERIPVQARLDLAIQFLE